MRRREFNRLMLLSSAGALMPRARTYTINPDRLRASLESLSRFGRNPEGGVSRVAWTKPDIEARRFVMDKLMSGMGLENRIDPAGSIYGWRAGKENHLPIILFGSHIDSVPKGG